MRGRLVEADMRLRAGQATEAARLATEVNQWASEHGPAPLARSHLVLSSIFESVGDSASGLDHALRGLELLDDDTPARTRGNFLIRLADAMAVAGSLGLVPNRVVDGLRAPILGCWCRSHSRRRGPSMAHPNARLTPHGSRSARRAGTPRLDDHRGGPGGRRQPSDRLEVVVPGSVREGDLADRSRVPSATRPAATAPSSSRPLCPPSRTARRAARPGLGDGAGAQLESTPSCAARAWAGSIGSSRARRSCATNASGRASSSTSIRRCSAGSVRAAGTGSTAGRRQAAPRHRLEPGPCGDR